MSILSKIVTLLPFTLVLGFGVGVFYLVTIMFFITGYLPDVKTLPGNLSSLKQIAEVLGNTL